MKKIIKYLLIGILALLLLISGYLVVSGNTYVFFLLKNTVLKGRLSPDIDEYQIFENREVPVGKPKPWVRSVDYNSGKLTAEENDYHNQFGSAAFVVIKNGELFHEQYWNGYSDSSHTNSWSMAKSIVSHLIGCAIKQGLINSVKDPISQYLPEYNYPNVTIENLLTMSSGIAFDEDYLNPFGYPARSLYGKDIKKVHKRYTEFSDAGKTFDYQSANTQLLAFILMKVTKQTLSEYASKNLWQPIGAEHPAYWSLDKKDGIEKAYCCFNTNALDFAKFGFLYLNQGIVDGDTLISTSYYQKCIQPDTTLQDGSGVNQRYSYQWWNINYEAEQILYARGIQGQYIFILPKSNLVIVRLGKRRSATRLNGHPEDVYEYLRQGKRLSLKSN